MELDFIWLGFGAGFVKSQGLPVLKDFRGGGWILR